MGCAACGVIHIGPCPRQPNPPATQELRELSGWLPPSAGRARSNALTSNDPRMPPSAAELSMKAELAKPALMAPVLEKFALLCFRTTRIMEGSADVSRLIYELYCDAGSGGNTPEMEIAKQFFLAVWMMRTKYSVLADGFLQYTEVSLESMAAFCEVQENRPSRKYLEDFLYFPVARGKAGYRLYLNGKFPSIPDLLNQICAYMMRRGDHGVTAFKAAGPFAAGRADSIVAYCATKAAAEQLGRHMLTFPAAYNAGVPGLTARLDPNLGVAIGAEPEAQATGLQVNPKGYPESAQSFGTIRAQLIAMAILNYNANVGVYGSGFDVFKRFVCTAFRGYGLNPLQPED
jgi:hypothetical protein